MFLWCRHQKYDLTTGDLILFNPGDNHACAPLENAPLDYRAINLKPEVMRRAVREITGRTTLPRFIRNVVFQSDLAGAVRDLYVAIVRQAPRLEKEESLFFVLEQLLREHTVSVMPGPEIAPNPRIEALCRYLEQRFSEKLTLADLLRQTDCGKSYLLRSFTKQVGVSPYRYLQTIRLDRAKNCWSRACRRLMRRRCLVFPIRATSQTFLRNLAA